MKISLQFVPKGPIDNVPALVQIMAWHRIGDKPLSEPMMSWDADAYKQYYTILFYQCYFLQNSHYTHPIAQRWGEDVNGLVQERRNSSALAMELRLSCTNPSNYGMSSVSVMHLLQLLFLKVLCCFVS